MWRWKPALCSSSICWARRKKPPEDYADHEGKRQKDSDSAGQYSSRITDEIGREVKRCIEVNTEVLKKKTLRQAEEVIKLLHSRICQCIAKTLVQQLTTLGSEFLGTVSKTVGLCCISYMLAFIVATTLYALKCTLLNYGIILD